MDCLDLLNVLTVMFGDAFAHESIFKKDLLVISQGYLGSLIILYFFHDNICATQSVGNDIAFRFNLALLQDLFVVANFWHSFVLTKINWVVLLILDIGYK